MNNSQIATAVALRDLSCYSLETISDRILLQKKIFLAQEIGLPLGYGYSWYIHGPYSTDLTAVAYQVIPEGIGSIENNHLKEPYASLIARVNSIEDRIEEFGLQISVAQWYELVASVAYWNKNGYITEREVVTKLNKTKPQFSELLATSAYTSFITFKSDS